jgi:hypothetical protein
VNQNVHYLSRVEALPANYIAYLKERGKTDGRDYIKEFGLEPKVGLGKTVISAKAYFYDNAFKQRKSYVIKGDKLEIVKEQGDYSFVRYKGKKTVEGWIKKEDLE